MTTSTAVGLDAPVLPTSTASRPETRLVSGLTWTVQGLLAALFVFAGAMKFLTPVEQMTQNLPLPAAFLYFIGAAEIAGGLGLVLPGMLRVLRRLTPLAALGLLAIMIGAVTLTARMSPAMALLPGVVGLLLAFVAYRRRAWLVR